ncbi:protein mono-ADP-ribosyltransferase PARP4-like, partial [Electrophorus electricus]|uniref:protein mono-ADP-ribosyltransferase PARP4-like n=1 Tax=Electrophorus electricus TaxID=8005 RepID=UPI0015CFF65C
RHEHCCVAPKGQKVSQVHPELPDRKEDTYLEELRLYKGNEDNTPEFPSHFQVAEYSFFLKAVVETWAVVELQSARGEGEQQYRVTSAIIREVSVVQDQQVHCCSSEDALEAYVQFNTELQSQGFTQTESLPSEAEALASHTLQRLLLEERLSCCDVSQDVGVFLELIWTEALGSLASLLTVPVTSLSLNDVSRVEGLLLQVQKCESEDEVQLLLQEVSTLLPLRETEAEARAKLVSQRLDLCQLIRDILNVSEATLGNPSPSSLGKYCTLRCNIEPVASESPEYQSVCKILQERPVQIQQVLRVCRSSELHMFREQLCNIKPLLHSTFPSNFVGILSRGLLLPRVGVEQHGIKRTDVGNLGSGIYFSDSLNTSVKYSRPSVTDGSRLLLVCDVALGQCKDVYKKDPSLICAPDGHSSVHGVRRTQSTRSRDDEYVVYNTDQVRLKYVVQYFLKEDQLKPFEPHIDTSVECLPSVMTSDLLSSDDAEGLEVTKNPLEDVTPGLLDSSGSTLPLEAVHVRCKLMDLLCQVIIFQVYTNKSDILIEAKYVFPLEETAAVCGFEAFINGKHVVGKVKEKEQARKEYKQAIEKGHGAYLMDQEAPDVFTISVGNLPAGATVLIKVTYITELAMRSGTVVFSLPASVAPWQRCSKHTSLRLLLKGSCLVEELVLMLGLFVLQTFVEKVGVKELRAEGVFSLHMSIEMPYEITGLECSHRIRTKRTDCKAMVVTLPDQSLSTDGFQLSFSLSQMHMPRMWVEKHPEKDSEACMLVFYPDFECGDARWSGVSDVVIVLDTSESMRGEPLVNARRLALKALCSLDRSLRVNVVCFGIDYKEAFPSPRVLEEVFEQAKTFIMSSPAVGGSTELWRPLRSLNLLPPSRGLRNVLLLSDGHMQNQPQTLQLVRGNACHTRLFTCGLRWVKSQVRCMASPGCMSVSVKWQRFNPTEPPPVQAPSQLSALFSNCHTLVYGFMPHCSQATLFGDLSGQEIQTMVSTTELQKTKGTFLHKLTARAIIRDYEDGSLGISEAEHEGRKAELKSYIIELSKEFSILSQFTSFVAIEERDPEQPESGFTSVPDLISEGDGNVDILPYMGWLEEEEEGSSLSDPYLMELGAVECDAEYKKCLQTNGSSSLTSDLPCSPPGSEMVCTADMSVHILHDDEESSQDYAPPPSEVSELLAPPRDTRPYICTSFVPSLQPSLRAATSPRDIDAHLLSDVPVSSPVPPVLGGISSRIHAMSSSFFGQRSKGNYLGAEPTVSSVASLRPLSLSGAPPSSFGGRGLFGSSRRSLICLDREPSEPLNLCAGGGFSFRAPPPIDSQATSPPITSHPITSPPISSPLIASAYAIGFAPHIPPPPSHNAAPPVPRATPPVPQATPPVPQAPPHIAAPEIIEFARRIPPRRALNCISLSMAPPPVPQATPLVPQAPPPIGFGDAIGLAHHVIPYTHQSHSCLLPQAPPPVPQAPPPPPIPAPAVIDLLPHSSSTLDTSDDLEFQFLKMVPKRGYFEKRRGSSRQDLFRFARKHVQKRRQPDTINWEELFDLQHQDGYWECTWRLSTFLGLDVDFFANVFLKEKGICSLGVKVHTAILRLVATLLVLQLVRVKMVLGVELFHSLMHLANAPKSRPACWEAVQRAVSWAQGADRQYPCVCTRLKLGWDWESCTRQLLGLDAPPPHSPLLPVLQRSACTTQVQK